MLISKRFDGGSLFSGANSAKGFVSFYDTILSDQSIERIYILKGGPGTGKSRFMRDAASRAEKKGLSVENYNCSSDPDSLDAVVIGGKYAILDGTAPHAVDPSSCGAREEIINLGAFWDTEKLSENYEKIKALSKAKSKCYAMAYRYLSAAKSVFDINSVMVLPCFKKEKAERAVDRLFSSLKTGGGFSLDVGVICSVGMKGRVRYDTYEHFADKVYLIEEHYDTASLLLRAVVKKAEATDTPVRVSYDPINTEKVNAVFFPNDRKAFVISDGKDKLSGDVRINMRRFVDDDGIKKIRNEYRLNKKLSDALVDSALDSLKEAGKHHFELENIYISSMDFLSKEVFCNNLLDNLIK